MPKILIVLSAIFVVSGISAGNADSDPSVSSDQCILNIEKVHNYIMDKLDETPDSESKKEMELRVKNFFEDIVEDEVNWKLFGHLLDHDMYTPDGDHIDCEFQVALKLSDLLDAVDELHKKSTE